MAFKKSGTFRHHHSGQVHRIVYKGSPFEAANIVWISARIPDALFWLSPAPGTPEVLEAGVDGGPMLLAWAKMQLWEPLPAVAGDGNG